MDKPDCRDSHFELDVLRKNLQDVKDELARVQKTTTIIINEKSVEITRLSKELNISQITSEERREVVTRSKLLIDRMNVEIADLKEKLKKALESRIVFEQANNDLRQDLFKETRMRKELMRLQNRFSSKAMLRELNMVSAMKMRDKKLIEIESDMKVELTRLNEILEMAPEVHDHELIAGPTEKEFKNAVKKTSIVT